MEAENDVDSTRRCLFPANVDYSFESAPLDGLLDGKSSSPLSRQPCSPTTVFESFPPSSMMKRQQSLRSTIVMGEDGAEVTLSMAQLTLQETPEKASSASPQATPTTPMHRDLVLGQVRNSSLMDVDWTPTPPPSKQKKERDYNFVNSWCGNASAHCVCDDDDEYEVKYDPSLEEIISSLLGNENDPMSFDGMSSCYDWQEWSYSFNNNSKHVVDVNDEEDSDSIKAIRMKLKKRVLNLKTRKSRVHQLRRDLSPFNNTPHCGTMSPQQLGRSRSFSVSDHQSAIVRRSVEIQKHSFSNVLQLCTLPENAVSESPMLKRYHGHHTDREDVCYDSDPEDFARQRSPLRPSMDKENYHTYSHSPRTRTNDLSDESDHGTVIQEFLNRTFTLAYHPRSSNEASVVGPTTSPVGVDAWLERGQRLRSLIPPKWMWRPKSRYEYKARGVLVRTEAVRSLELLDISRILKVDRVDRNLYPFAKPNKCLLIRNIDGDEFCFEAKSTEERDIIAFSLKLVIARFGAMVIATNHKVYDEFFVTDHCVPGKPPRVLERSSSTHNLSSDSGSNC